MNVAIKIIQTIICYCFIQFYWQALEIAFYGKPDIRTVDFVIGLSWAVTLVYAVKVGRAND